MKPIERIFSSTEEDDDDYSTSMIALKGSTSPIPSTEQEFDDDQEVYNFLNDSDEPNDPHINDDSTPRANAIKHHFSGNENGMLYNNIYKLQKKLHK